MYVTLLSAQTVTIFIFYMSVVLDWGHEDFNHKILGTPHRYLDCEDGEDDSQKFTSKNLDESVKYPMDMPVSLHFNQSDVFDGKHGPGDVISTFSLHIFICVFKYMYYII